MTNSIKKIKNIFAPYLGLPREIYVIFISRIINAMGFVVYPLLTLILTQKIGLTNQETGFWVTIAGLISLSASIIGGKLADTFGRKKIILISDLLAAITYILCANTEPTMHLVYFIILVSFFMGVSDPAHNSLLADLTTPQNRDGAYSLSYLGFNLGFIIAPSLGAFLLDENLQLLFWIDAATAIIGLSLIFFFVKEKFSTKKEDFTEERRLEKSETGSIFKVLVSRPILLYFSLILFGYSFVYSQWSYLIPIQIGELYENVMYGLLASLNAVIVIFFTPILTSLFSNIKNIRKIVYGGILYAIGFGILGFTSVKAAFFIGVIIFTLGEILVTISYMPFIANHTPASHRGRMSSTTSIILGLGYSTGPLMMGIFLKYGSIDAGWKLIGLIMLISTYLMYNLEKKDVNKN